MNSLAITNNAASSYYLGNGNINLLHRMFLVVQRQLSYHVSANMAATAFYSIFSFSTFAISVLFSRKIDKPHRKG